MMTSATLMQIELTSRSTIVSMPEKVIPDPEQVERDRKEAEKIYGDQKDRKAS
jgi:hypothetical protein